MVGRGEITDAAWERIAPPLPPNGKRGGQWKDHRTVLNGILWKLRTGAPWRGSPLGSMPARYGSRSTCADRLARWEREGVWDRLLTEVQAKSDAVGEVVWEVSVDSTTVRAHQHAAGAKKGAATRRSVGVAAG